MSLKHFLSRDGAGNRKGQIEFWTRVKSMSQHVCADIPRANKQHP